MAAVSLKKIKTKEKKAQTFYDTQGSPFINFIEHIIYSTSNTPTIATM